MSTFQGDEKSTFFGLLMFRNVGILIFLTVNINDAYVTM
jgi:hypothetical protein